MNQKTEAIIAQACALAKFRREIEELKQYTASLLSDCKRVQDSLDMERDQHGKTKEELSRYKDAQDQLTTERDNARAELEEGLKKNHVMHSRIAAMEAQILMGGDEARLKTAHARIKELEKELRGLTE